MPELPEAETIVQGIRPALLDARISGIELVHADVVGGDPTAFAAAVVGRAIREVRRRGKNIVLDLDSGGHLVVNLGMSGRLLHRREGDPSPPPTHPAVRWSLAEGGTLVYHDVRRFGLLRALSGDAYRAWAATLGPEPLGPAFTARELGRRLAGSRAPARSWLLDQRKVAGIGNIYASEALHRAGIHPRRPAGSIAADGVRRLHRAIRAVLRESIESQGTTLRDYRTALGEEGSYAARLRVYGRAGEPCPRCGTPVERIVFANRSAFLCPRCQPE